MANPTYRDIKIRGVTYPDVASAANALGVGHNTVLKALHKGRLDGVGLGARGIPTMPVRICGQDFPSAEKAAEYFGVGRSAIYYALAAGDPDRVGRKPIAPKHCSRPFYAGGMRWPSLRAASIDLGFSPEFISKAYRYNRRGAKQRILAAAMQRAQAIAQQRGGGAGGL